MAKRHNRRKTLVDGAGRGRGSHTVEPRKGERSSEPRKHRPSKLSHGALKDKMDHLEGGTLSEAEGAAVKTKLDLSKSSTPPQIVYPPNLQLIDENLDSLHSNGTDKVNEKVVLPSDDAVLKHDHPRGRGMSDKKETSCHYCCCRRPRSREDDTCWLSTVSTAVSMIGSIYQPREETSEPLSDPDPRLLDTDGREVSIKYLKLLGRGNFGQVHQVEIVASASEPPLLAAVKEPRQEGQDSRVTARRAKICIKDILNEIKVRKRLSSHPNLVNVHAWRYNLENPMLVLEYLSGGNLQDFLYSKRIEKREANLYEQLADHIIEVGRAIRYLHAHLIIHRDIAARNVMMNTKGICKLTDLGMAKILSHRDATYYQLHGVLPHRWMAPESCSKGLWSMASDIWTFAILMWEVLSLGDKPYQDYSRKRIRSIVSKGVMLEQPELCTDEMFRYMTECWSLTASKRPSCTTLISKLEDLRSSQMQKRHSK